MGLSKVSNAALKSARQKYLDTLTNVNETKSAYLHLSALEVFVNAAKEMAKEKGQSDLLIPVAFLRDRLNTYGGPYLEIDKGVYQLSIALALKGIDDDYLVLEPGGETTGLCPVNCGVDAEF